MVRAIALLAVSIWGLSSVAQAGDYGKSYDLFKKEIPESRRYYNHRVAPKLTEEQMPKAFDWGDVNGTSMLVPSWNQHIPLYCGACYLHGSLSMISDRISVVTGGKSRVMLGRQTFLNCAPFHGLSRGCDGGDVIDVVEYMAQFGLPDESCMPYRALDNRDLPEVSPEEGLTKKEKHCPTRAHCMNCMPNPKTGEETCWSVPTPVTYYLSAYGLVEDDGPENRVEAMMSEIMHHGPITCGMAASEEFAYHYDGGIFYDVTDKHVDHDVEIVGWGEENGVKFWNARNSWGTYWGNLSYFRVQRGVNSNMIENGDCWYADPLVYMEEDVKTGKLIGSMYGLKKPDSAKMETVTSSMKGRKTGPAA